MMRGTPFVSLAAVAMASVTVGGCGDDAMDPSSRVVERPRIGATPAGSDASLYFDITSGELDRLLSAETDVAESVTLHGAEMVVADDPTLDVDRIDLPTGTTVRLRPFGAHVMLEDLNRDLAPGDVVDVTLHFMVGEPVEIRAEVAQLFDLAFEET